MIGDMYGAFPANTNANRIWAPQIEVSLDNVGVVPAGEFTVDPWLPAVGVDPFDPASAVVLPRGRFVSYGFTNGRGAAYYRQTLADTGKTPLTLHDGQNLTPTGMSINQMYKETGFFMRDSNTVRHKRAFQAELPFVLSINNANGTLSGGDYVTSYYGSTTSTSVVSYVHRGKPVKWLARKSTTSTAAASAIQVLSSAIYPGVKPSVSAAFNTAGALISGVTASLSYVGGAWQATFSPTALGSAVATVAYTTGQDADQIAGECERIRSISDLLNTDNFLKWVEAAPIDTMNWPPLKLSASRFPVTPVALETPTTVVANELYQVLCAPNPMSVYYPVIVQVTNATVTDMHGNATNYTGGNYFVLPASQALYDTTAYFVGLYHTVNWRTGVIEIGDNVTGYNGGNMTVQVSYSYITDPRDGAVIWGGGLLGLTDGYNVPAAGSTTSPSQTDWEGNTVYATPSGIAYGVPAHLNLSDVVAALRIWVK